MRRIIWLLLALCSVIMFAEPTSSRAYFKYVPPQPPAKRYKVVKTIQAHVSFYVKPKREEFDSAERYRAAIKMNGYGKVTRFGDIAEEGVAAADVDFGPHRGQFKHGTVLYIVEINKIVTVKDYCRKAEDYTRVGKVLVDVFTGSMTHRQAYAWGRRPMTVKILLPV